MKRERKKETEAVKGRNSATGRRGEKKKKSEKESKPLRTQGDPRGRGEKADNKGSDWEVSRHTHPNLRSGGKRGKRGRGGGDSP